MQARQQKKSSSVEQSSKISVSSFIQDFLEGSSSIQNSKIAEFFQKQSNVQYRSINKKMFKPIQIKELNQAQIVQTNSNNEAHKQKKSIYHLHQRTTTESSYQHTEPKIQNYQVQRTFHRPTLSQRMHTARDSSNQSRQENQNTVPSQQQEEEDKCSPIRIANLLFSDLKERNKIGDWHFIHHLREKAIPLNKKLPDWFASRKDFLNYANKEK